MTRRRLRVLVVEDDPGTLALTVSLLETLGHSAAGMGSAELALNRFFEGAFDVLVSDISLPCLSGQDFAEKLQGRCDLPRHLAPHALFGQRWRRQCGFTSPSESRLGQCASALDDLVRHATSDVY